MNTPFSDLIPALPDIGDAVLCRALQTRLDEKTKPQGALGSLETLAVRLGEILGTATPRLEQPQLVVLLGGGAGVVDGRAELGVEPLLEVVGAVAEAAAAVQRGRQGTFVYVVRDDATVTVRPSGSVTMSSIAEFN
mgnify:CR=1 FL=1